MRRGVVWVWVVLASVLLVPGAWAQRPPETHPSSARQDIVMSWDRSAMPGDIELWAPRTVLAYSDAPDLPYAKAHLVCTSASDARSGRCPTIGSPERADGTGEVWLRAVEKRSGLETEFRARAGLQRPMDGVSCYSDYWSTAVRPPWSANLEVCGRHRSSGIGVELRIGSAELGRLVAGRWSAELVMVLRQDIDGLILATYTFNFDFTITDYDAVSIYFPEFPQTTPNVDLNLSYDPLAQTVGGRKPLDMCLYDGLGSQSEYLGLTVTDTSGRSPGPLGYSLWHDDGGSSDDQRLDYMIELEHAGVRRRMANGVEEQLRGIDTAKLRLVLLPGMTQPVFCVPTPLLLTTPRVPITEQRAGGYEGQLKVELRLPTTRP